MSSIPVQTQGPHLKRTTLQLPLDESRGSSGMKLFILTEAMLFVMMFVAYFFLAKGTVRWQIEEAPSLSLTLPMLGILLLSSAVMDVAEKKVKEHQYGHGRIAVLITMALGVLFLYLQTVEYRHELEHITPQVDSYGSIFFSITTLHGAHVAMGLLMLAYVMLLPQFEPTGRTPHRPLHNAALYWHFVDLVWVVIVTILYIVPNIR